MNNERIIKLIVLGDSGVGKTSIIERIKSGKFQKMPSGGDIITIQRKYESKNIMIKLNFLDGWGSEPYVNLYLGYIHNSNIILLVFSDINTLNILRDRWNHFYKEKANLENSIIILIGNKSDIFEDKRDEILNKGQEFADEIDTHFLTCSAKTGDNMDNLERIIISEAKRFIDKEEKEKEKKYYSIKKKAKKDKRENLKNDNYEHKKIVNYDDENKVSIWQNSKLNKYISF